MKNIIKYILILVILITLFIILNFYKSKKNSFDDIIILGLWDDSKVKNEYEIKPQNIIKIDVFNTINNKKHKKIAPGDSGTFTIILKKTEGFDYNIKITEKTSKPHNLIFLFEDKMYLSIKDMEKIINEKFINTDKITINWEWKYHINEEQDKQDTKDGEKGQRYIFEIEAIVEEQERKDA